MNLVVKKTGEKLTEGAVEKISSRLKSISREEILFGEMSEIFKAVINMGITPIQVHDGEAKNRIKQILKEAYRIYYLSEDPTVEWPIEKVRQRYGITSSSTLPYWRERLGLRVEPRRAKKNSAFSKTRSPNCPDYITQEELMLLDLYYVFFSRKSGQRFYAEADYEAIVQTPVYDENLNHVGYQSFDDLFTRDNPTFFSWHHYILDQEINKGRKLLNT